MMYRVIPKHNDKKVIDPSTMKKVSMEGVVISKKTTYWKRIEKDGDVTITKVIAKKPKQNNGGNK